MGARGPEEIHCLGALDIIKESVAALRAISSLFFWVAALLATPFSIVVLSQAWITSPVVENWAARIEASALATRGGVWFLPSYRAACFKLVDNLVSHAFQLPFYITLAIPARATISWAVALLYSSRKFHLHSFLRAAALKVCLRAIATYLWICAVMLACTTLILSLLVVVTTFFQALGLSVDILFLIVATICLAFSLLFAHLVIISNLSITISMLEDIQGRAALMKAILILRGRTQVGLLLFIIATAATASIDSLFQYRVVGVPGYKYAIDLSSKLWEMPLLVGMYSFLYLFNSIPSAIFYFTCKSSCCESFDRFFLPENQ
ncbi:hypothetical protein SELMODRAFT_82741 [Selaginella moellendorffii]|uniref:Uncharacterized protein n=1 Tax=Selaginella moellendorffii TaxID=88036 RepID=D8R1E9_SELML|nr:hypothetical protein SELMODRAFT_82741 [Selaginella moellendorffii]